MAVPAMAPTTTLSIEMAGRAIPWVIPVTARSCSRLLNRAGSGVPPPLGSEIFSWKGSPYSLGVAVRCDRLAPKTAVPHSAITAKTVASRALPTGTLAPPLLRSSALRIPITTLGGAPIAQRRLATLRA